MKSFENFKSSEQVALTRVGAVEISTVNLHDMGIGFETCLFHDNGKSQVVGRYSSEVESLRGHIKWVNRLLDFDYLSKHLFTGGDL